MRPLTLVITLFMALALSLSPVTAQDKGQKDHTLFGGKSGDVPFPHHLHQDALDDCNACHSSFPQEQGALASLKKAGTLKKKQVMNKTCLKCHRSMKKAKAKTGPTSCKGCHVK